MRIYTTIALSLLVGILLAQGAAPSSSLVEGPVYVVHGICEEDLSEGCYDLDVKVVESHPSIDRKQILVDLPADSWCCHVGMARWAFPTNAILVLTKMDGSRWYDPYGNYAPHSIVSFSETKWRDIHDLILTEDLEELSVYLSGVKPMKEIRAREIAADFMKQYVVYRTNMIPAGAGTGDREPYGWKYEYHYKEGTDPNYESAMIYFIVADWGQIYDCWVPGAYEMDPNRINELEGSAK